MTTTPKICSEAERAFLLSHLERDANGAVSRQLDLVKSRPANSTQRMEAFHCGLQRYLMLQPYIAAIKAAPVVSA